MEIKSYPIKKTKQKKTETKSKNKKFKSNISVKDMTSGQHKKAAHQNSLSFN